MAGMNVVTILKNNQYDMKKFWDQIHTVVAMLPMEDWYETNALVRLRRGTVVAFDLGVIALALVVLLDMAILAATKTEEVATPALILRLAKQLEAKPALYLLYCACPPP